MTKIQTSKSHYETLLVTQASKLEDITKHYRKLCLIFHPDKNKTHGAEDVFKKVASAYETLKDSDSRRLYDQQLQMLYRSTVPVRSGFTSRPVQPRPPPTRSAQAAPPSRSQTVWKDGKVYELPNMIKCPSCQSVFQPSSFHVNCHMCNTYLFAGVEVVLHPHQRAGFQPPRPYPYVPNFDSFFPKKPSAPNHAHPSTYPHPPGFSPYIPQQPPTQPPPAAPLPVRPDFREMTVKDIKSFLEQQQADFSDCVEKADLVRRAETVWSERQQSSTGATPHPPTHSHHEHSRIPPTFPHPPQSHPSSGEASNLHRSQQPDGFQNSEQTQNPQQRPKAPEKENIPGGNSSSAKKPPKKTPKKKRKGVAGGYDEELDSDVEDPDKKRRTGASTMSRESMDGIDLSNIVPEGTRRSARTAATKKVSYVVPSEDDIAEVDATTFQQWSRKKQDSKAQEALQELERLRKSKVAEEKTQKDSAGPSAPPSSTPSASTSPTGKSKPKPKDVKVEESSSDNDMFEVEAIVGKKIEVRGKRTTIRYQVKWKDTEDLTWEPTSHLRQVKDLIQEYEEKAAKAETSTKAEELEPNEPNVLPKSAEDKDKDKDKGKKDSDSDPKTAPEPKKEPGTKKRPLAEADEKEAVHIPNRKRKAPLVEEAPVELD
eukprot:CAMPEP_0196653890 /NCGR_PEP_ID=MMETSP1086-20130531/3545_1 /TAXON_ID=77921 /ORGANISM="Cyanoptyche  gloeocystis , Strain SAG4.97" /LENGTH=653 /DNA_ID=CAMNT_0041985321 /DNA_START=100 /DNA_END=2061 /DNA_ORIENTATION=+